MKGYVLVLLLSAIVLYELTTTQQFLQSRGTSSLLFIRSARRRGHPLEQTPRKKNPLNTAFALLLLLTSGDVHPNPGPTVYPCGLCDRQVGWTDCVCCDECDLWYHRSCLELCTRDFSALARSNVQWLCCKCDSINIASFTFRSYEISPSFYEPLSHDISEASFRSGDPFDPLLSSSPKSPPQPSHTTAPCNAQRTPDLSKHGRQRSSHSSITPMGQSYTTGGPPPKSKDNLRVLTVNCQRIVGKTAEFAATLDYIKPDVVCGTESWLAGIKPGKPPSTHSVKSSEVFPSNYIPHRNDRNTLGGGVFVLTRNDLVASELTEASNVDEGEIIWTKINTSSKELFIGSFYMPHRNKSDLEKLDASLKKISKKKERNIMLCGDFNCPNINWDTHTVEQGAPDKAVQQALIDIVEEHGLHQVHDFPTRGESRLDIVFTTNPTLLKASVNVPGISDHDIVVSDFCIRPYYSHQSAKKCFLYGKANWDELRQAAADVSGRVSSLSDDGADTNTLWETFKEDLQKATDLHVPSVKKSRKQRLPWFSRRLKRLLKKKGRLYRQARKTGIWTNYRHMQKECKRSFRRAEWDYLNNVITDGLQRNDSKPFWRYVKSKKKDNIGVSPLKRNGSLCSDGKGKANILLDQFKSVFTRSSSPTKSTLQQFPDISKLQISKNGVEKLLKNIDTSKAVGPDNISNRVLKECASELAEGLTIIFQKSVDTGILPDDWTKANVAPVFKKGDRHLPENYRPVSLTSVTCKLLEHIIYSHVMKHMERHKVLTDLNHGFRTGYSCETQLVVTLRDLCRSFEKNCQVDIAILDFSKAFDTVPHMKLLEKMESYGIRGTLHTWLTTFLTKRSMRVVVDGQLSAAATVDSGVPQGTVLGPLLFLCHINDLPAAAKSQVRLFADDCLLYREIKTQTDHAILQRDLKALQDWAEEWGMRFNAQKCYILSIRNESSHFYQLNDQFLQTVHSNPYLGVLLEDNLSWSNHISRIAKRASSSLGMIKRNLQFCPSECKKTAYVSLVRSLMEYCSIIWDPYLQKDIDKLEIIQRRAARFIKRDYKSRQPGCVSGMLNDLRLESLQERRRQHRLTFLYKVVEGHFPALKAENYITPARNKRLIRPSHKQDCESANIISSLARNNSRCFNIEFGRTEVFKNSFFPRTIRDWNSLSEQQVSAVSIEEFKTLLSTGAQH